jgi:soluble lytic murein transglycosylase-like protein
LEAFRNIDKLTTSDIVVIQKFDPFLAIRLAVRRFGIRSDIYQYIAYPTPYREFVEDAYKTFGVDKNLIWAIMRQESLFDPLGYISQRCKGAYATDGLYRKGGLPKIQNSQQCLFSKGKYTFGHRIPKGDDRALEGRLG